MFAAISTATILMAAAGCGTNSPVPPAASSTALPSKSVTSAAPSTTPTHSPSIVKRKVTVTKRIPYKTRRVTDPTLRRGHTEIRIKGRSGIRTLTYAVTYVNGERKHKRLVGRSVTRRPITKIIAVGTKDVRSCDPNYSGACVPIASDVDCAGNDGNGPAYVEGPVRVTGDDIYDLDRDGDGIGCD